MARLFLAVTLWLILIEIKAQDFSGCWQGVEYNPGSGTATSWPSLFCLSQSGNNLTGTLYQVAGSSTQYYVDYMMIGSVSSGVMNIQHSKVNKGKLPPGSSRWCMGNIKMTYDPIEEKLTGESTYPDRSCNGTIELYRIALKSPAIYCKGQPISLKITGKDVKWYADPETKKLVNQGNTFAPNLSETTTYYVTQTHYNKESPAVPIKIEIVGPPVVTNSIVKDPTCGLHDGAITLTATGSGQIKYKLNNGSWEDSPEFKNLKAGAYSAFVKDGAGCVDSSTVTIETSEAPKIISLTIEAATCGITNGKINLQVIGIEPLTYFLNDDPVSNLSNITNLASGIYTVVVKDKNACSIDTSLTIPQQTAPTIQELKIYDPSCGRDNGEIGIVAQGGPLLYSLGGTDFQPEPNFKGLSAGEYSIHVKDQNGCLVIRDTTLAKSESPTIQNIEVQATTCGQNNGSLLIFASGSSLQYSIDNLDFQSNTAFDNLKPSIYNINVKDNNGCLATGTAEVLASSGPKIDHIVNEPTSCEEANGKLVIQASGSGDLVYAINGGISQSDNTFINLNQGTYEIEVKDSQRCFDKQTVTIREDCHSKVFVPEIFTPNGDNYNEVLEIKSNFSGEIKLTILSRWGEVVFQTDNATVDYWKGTYKGKKLDGEFVYILQFQDKNSKKIVKRGSVLCIK